MLTAYAVGLGREVGDSGKEDPRDLACAIPRRSLCRYSCPADGYEWGSSSLFPGYQTRTAANNLQYDATPDTAPPAYSSPGDDTTILEDAPSTQQPEPKELRQEPETSRAGQPSAFSAPAVAATVKSAAADTYEDLKDKLSKAEATITSLRSEVAGGLRQRKTAATASGSGDNNNAGTPQLAQAQRPTSQGTEGVPVQVVALLCLASFLLAYFFF